MEPGFHHSNQWPISSKYNPSPVSAAARLTSIQILLTQFYLSGRGQGTEGGWVGGENTAFHQRGREVGKHRPLQFASSKCFMLLCVFLVIAALRTIPPLRGSLREIPQRIYDRPVCWNSICCTFHNA